MGWLTDIFLFSPAGLYVPPVIMLFWINFRGMRADMRMQAAIKRKELLAAHRLKQQQQKKQLQQLMQQSPDQPPQSSPQQSINPTLPGGPAQPPAARASPPRSDS
ncbi:hypothetical protein FVE85_6539 [Porphyridium purpureum]|uniref:Uncharacterized protein n=1 Tax=Porphyridium purpureum TaxID=35688 RepID=A0A5J4Z7I5_PORPP|nr:hypothetical protein FVE85_6539 [Porphyridium purpureum]|eukprot:POR0548..scf295_1